MNSVDEKDAGKNESDAEATVRSSIVDGIALAGVFPGPDLEPMVENILRSLFQRCVRWSVVEYAKELESGDAPSPTHQCPSTYASKKGQIVFCVKREGHEGNHRGYRKMWDHAGVLIQTVRGRRGSPRSNT